jgi:hypothetical protein
MNALFDLCRVYTSTVGTGTLSLGAPVAGYLDFAQAGVPDGAIVSYAIADAGHSESGQGTYDATAKTLTRSVYRSTAAGNNTPIALTGSAQVFITALAADFWTGGPFLPLSGGTLSGLLTLSGPPTANLHAATKAYADGLVVGLAPLASPIFTGDPKAPTPATADNDTSIATTSFVKAQGYQTGNQTITISGDVSGSGTTAISLTLATVNANIGTWNNVTVNAKGLVTAGNNVAYLTGNQTITLSGDASGAGATAIAVTLATVNANVGTFQGLTIDAKGRVTAASNQNYVTGGPYLPLTGGTLTGSLTVGSGGAIYSAGTNAAFFFQDRSGATNWAWYCNSNIARLHNGSTDVLTISNTGAISATGPITFSNYYGGSFSFGWTPGGYVHLGVNGADNYYSVIGRTDAGIGVCGLSCNSAGTAITCYLSSGGSCWWGSTANSARALKSNLSPTAFDALAAVRGLTVYSCEMRNPVDESSAHWDCALIADEVELVVPVAYQPPPTADTYEGLHALPLITTLWRAVQQLAVEVETLKAKV